MASPPETEEGKDKDKAKEKAEPKDKQASGKGKPDGQTFVTIRPLAIIEYLFMFQRISSLARLVCYGRRSRLNR